MRLLVLDVEGTLFRTDVRLPATSINSTVWQGIAHALGPSAEAEEIETHRRWERGEYRSYLDWMKETISIHQRYGLTAGVFRRLISAADYNPGVIETLSLLDRTQYELVLISGGFRELAARAQRDLRIVHAFAACEYLFDDRGLLHSYNLLPCDFEGKLDFIHLMLREYGLSDADWAFVGDGANDVPIAKRAPISVGYQPHPDLRKVVRHAIEDFRDLLTIFPRTGEHEV